MHLMYWQITIMCVCVCVCVCTHVCALVNGYILIVNDLSSFLALMQRESLIFFDHLFVLPTYMDMCVSNPLHTTNNLLDITIIIN